MSANVGATRIQEQALALERAIRDGEPLENLQMRLVELELPLDGLLYSLDGQLGRSDGPPPGYRDVAMMS